LGIAFCLSACGGGDGDTSGGGGGGGGGSSVVSLGTAAVKWHPGHGLASTVFTNVGNVDPWGNPAGPGKFAEIKALRVSPAEATGWMGVYTWRSLQQNVGDGQVDCSNTGSGLDADYVAVTGYQSGTAGVGGGPVYNNPRRFMIAIATFDYFLADPQPRTLPDYIVNDPAYGPLGPDGKHYGYFLGPGWNGSATAAYTALYRPAIAGAYQRLMAALAAHVLPDGYTVDSSPLVEFVWPYEELSDEPQLIVNGSLMHGNQADPSFTSETAYFSQVATSLSVMQRSFPHTLIGTNNNYSNTARNMQTLSAAMVSAGTAFAAGDTFGLSSGSNIIGSPPGCGLCGETFGMLVYRGYDPPAHPYTQPWTPNGLSYKGAAAYLGLVAGTELILSFGTYYTPQDIVNQALLVGYTHLVWNWYAGLSGFDAAGNNMATANWLGAAASQAQWNTAPGTWGGVLDAIYNNPLTNTACPTNLSDECDTN
jgi:hypothetical protein